MNLPHQPTAAPARTQEIVIVADDFTGAAESAAVFAGSTASKRAVNAVNEGSGCNGVPVFLPESEGHPGRRICVLDSESRNASEEDALRRLKSTLHPWTRAGGHEPSNPPRRPIWFKKVDSTLRGHVAAETFGLMHLLDLEGAIVAPALPDEGRTTERGVQLVHGTPVASSHASRDAFSATKDDRLTSLFERSGWAPPTLVAASALDAGAIQACRFLEAKLRESPVCVIDATTNEDLIRIAACTLRLQRTHVLVGSAGLARAVAHVRAQDDSMSPQPRLGWSEAKRDASSLAGILVVRGSSHPSSMEQVEKLLDATEMAHHVLDMEDNQEVRFLSSWLARQGLVMEAPLPEDTRATAREAAVHIGEQLAEQVARLIDEVQLRGLVVAGGDTAYRILNRIGIGRLVTFGEVARNIPISWFRPAGRTKTVLVTKAGGFGSPNTMLEATLAAARAAASQDHVRDASRER